MFLANRGTPIIRLSFNQIKAVAHMSSKNRTPALGFHVKSRKGYPPVSSNMACWKPWTIEIGDFPLEILHSVRVFSSHDVWWHQRGWTSDHFVQATGLAKLFELRSRRSGGRSSLSTPSFTAFRIWVAGLDGNGALLKSAEKRKTMENNRKINMSRCLNSFGPRGIEESFKKKAILTENTEMHSIYSKRRGARLGYLMIKSLNDVTPETP